MPYTHQRPPRAWHDGFQDDLRRARRAAAGAKVAWTTHSVVSGTLASLAQGILLPLAKRQIKSLVQAVRATLSGEGETAAPAPSLVTRGTTSLRGLFGKAGGS